MTFPAEMEATLSTLTTTVTSTAGNNLVDDGEQVDYTLRGVWAFIDIVLFLAITGGNLITITAILRRPLVVSNLFVLSLACSDVSVGLMMPYHMAFYLEPRLNVQFQHCIARLALVSLACIASIFNILAIAADRFIAIVFPLHYPRIMTQGVARVIIGGVWLTAVVVATAPVYWHKWPVVSCQMPKVVHKEYIFLIYVPFFTLLICTMCGLYARILCEAWRHSDKYSPGRWKPVQVLMLWMGSFTFSYTPFFIINVVYVIIGMEGSASSVLYKLTNSLAMANSAINPIIYTWKNHEFKSEIVRLISCRDCKPCKPTLQPIPDGTSSQRSTLTFSTNLSTQL